MAPSTVGCGNMTKGTHESAPCSAKYLTCWNGKLGQANCLNSLVYNPLNGQCDYPINVKGCAQYSAAGPVSSQVPYGVTNSATNSS
uniref:Chitin-binding type-2 domain-containing protein n=1 Tax=Ditylenchus dipsaci TaxID=166011 RepID=A0A915DTK4_9BILA